MVSEFYKRIKGIIWTWSSERDSSEIACMVEEKKCFTLENGPKKGYVS